MEPRAIIQSSNDSSVRAIAADHGNLPEHVFVSQVLGVLVAVI